MTVPEPQNEAPSEAPTRLHFIEQIVERDLAAGLAPEDLRTRFPPEPNGYLHIGHAKAICLNFGLAAKYGGRCNLRFDDTNPTKEEQEYVDSIQADIRWLGFDWGEETLFTSDYFEQLYAWAVELIEKGLAYVDDLPLEEMRARRGSGAAPGENSPFRDRPVAENLDLFARMRAGEFPDGARTLRAKIDMASPNMNLRDPVLYRIQHSHHHRTGDTWCIYPMYDYAHGESDAIEGITHSVCTLEFENHRALYDWFIEHLSVPSRPRQYEFARLQLTYTMMSKRRLLELVQTGVVSGWDDPRMPTISGLRRRGYTPESLRAFATEVGVAKFNSTVDFVKLENAIRADLNASAERRMAVLDPLKLVITNYPEDGEELLEAVNNPEDEAAGTRQVPFARELWIEREDFREEANRKYFRLKPGQEVRLRYAYYVTCTGCVKDPATGEVTEVHCTYDPETRGGDSADGRKVKGTIHWVSARHAAEAEVRLYDHLFRVPDPDEAPEGGDWKDNLNPESLQLAAGAKLEPSLLEAKAGERFQFERQGYFCVDTGDSRPGAPVFNRTVALRSTWANIEKRAQQ